MSDSEPEPIPRIVGVVNDEFKVLIDLEFYRGEQPLKFPNVMVDTGYDMDVCMPLAEIQLLQMELLSEDGIDLEMADGQIVSVSLYVGTVNWLGRMREVSVAAIGDDIMIGMGILCDYKTTINRRVITIEHP